MTVTSDRAGGAPRNRHFLISFMKTGRFKSTSFAGITFRRDFQQSLPLDLINISRWEFRALSLFSLSHFLSFRCASSSQARSIAARSRCGLDNRSRCTSRSWRVSALGNLSSPVDCSRCNLSLSSPARMKDSPRLRIFVLRVCEALQISHAPPRNAKTWISLLSDPDVGSTGHPQSRSNGGSRYEADGALVLPTPCDSRHRSVSARILTPMSERRELGIRFTINLVLCVCGSQGKRIFRMHK